jgi:hypothetical protein
MKDIMIKNQKTDYMVSKEGKVFSKKTNKFLSQYSTPGGYMNVDLYTPKRRYKIGVHQLVALAFIPNPDNLPLVNHKDGDKTNNDLENLEWSTYSSNNQHAYDHGLRKPLEPEQCYFTKYTREQIVTVCRLLEQGWPSNVITDNTGVHENIISDIRLGKKWKSVSKSFNIRNDFKFRGNRNFSASQKEKMNEYIIEGYTNDEIIELMNVEKSLIKSLRKTLTYIRERNKG